MTSPPTTKGERRSTTKTWPDNYITAVHSSSYLKQMKKVNRRRTYIGLDVAGCHSTLGNQRLQDYLWQQRRPTTANSGL
jgi:hypothetical protein